MNNRENKKSIKYQLQSFRWALNGLSEFFRTEFKAIIHLAAALLAIITGLALNISLGNWLWITFAITLVFITEILNSAIELIANTIPDKFDTTRGKVKDLSAGAVLIASIAALTVAFIIFIPKIALLWKN